MKQIQRGEAKGRVAKSVLRLPDLEVAKSAVLNSLSCPDAQRGYRRTQSFAAAVNDKIGIESASWLIGPLAESRTTRSGTMRMLFPGRASAVREVGALSDLDNISVRIADVAARLAVFGDRLRDELRSSTFP